MPPACYLVEDGSISEIAVQHISSGGDGEHQLQPGEQEALLQIRFSSCSNSAYPTVMERALEVCRQHGALPKWNALHVSETDALRTIQLCIGERMKQECGEFCAQVSDVLAVHQHLNNSAIYGDATDAGDAPDASNAGGDADVTSYGRYLSSSHLVDGPGVLRALRRLCTSATTDVANGAEGAEGVPSWRRPTVVHGRPASSLERAVAALLTGDEPVAVRRAQRDGEEMEATCTPTEREQGEAQRDGEEVPCTPTEREKTELEFVKTVWHCVDVMPAPDAKEPTSATDKHIRNMFTAMFRLLINSRDELALAAACQAPGLELSGADFLAIRRAARASHLPMYQTVVSHVRRVELGGANYQSSADCPLNACTPPLKALVRLLHKLHDLLEEEPEPSKCCLRLLSAMKTCVSRGARFRQSAVERVAEELRQLVAQLAADGDCRADPAVVGGPAVQLVRRLCDRISCAEPPVTDHLSVLEDGVTSPGTPGRKPAALPSLVSLFRTPPEVDGEEESNDGVGVPLEERLRRKGIARTGDTPTTTKRPGCTPAWLPSDQQPPAGGPSPAEPTPPLVAGPTLVCSRSGTKYAAGEGLRALRELQAADRTRAQESEMMSPRTSRAPKKPKRSLFDPSAQSSDKASGPKSKGDASKTKTGAAKTAAKKRKTEAALDQENAPQIDQLAQTENAAATDGESTGTKLATNGGSNATKPAAKKRRTEAALDQENLLSSDLGKTKSQQQTVQAKPRGLTERKPKAKQIKQVTGQKSIRDFFRI